MLDTAYEQADEKFFALCDLLTAGRDDKKLGEVILGTYEKIQAHPDPRAFLEDVRAGLYTRGMDTPHGCVLREQARSAAQHGAAFLHMAVDELTGIDELAESIKVIGLQQPLVVRRKTEGGYLLLAGHRRRNALALLDRKTAPCIVLDADLDPSLQVLILHWTNTMARGGGGLTAEYTGQAAKEIEAALKDLQARGVVELPGKLRSYVAEVLKTSESQIARAKAINNGLTKAWQGDFKFHRIKRRL